MLRPLCDIHAIVSATLRDMRLLGLVLVFGAAACGSLLGIDDTDTGPNTAPATDPSDGGSASSGQLASSSGGSSSSSSTSSGQLASSGGSSGDASDAADAAPSVTADVRWAEQVAMGENFTCVRTRASQVWCWGDNSSGQLGNGTTATATRPVQVPGLEGVAEVAAGGFHACARLDSGKVRCWGAGSRGQIGAGTAEVRFASPTPASNLSTATALALGYKHSCALLANGTVQCWGNNTYGEVGQEIASVAVMPHPIAVTGASGVVALGSGSAASHTCASKSNGAVVCWGKNASDQLGGSGTSSPTPQPVPGVTGATNLCGSVNTSSVVLASGAVMAWGVPNASWEESGVPDVAPASATLVPGVSGVAQVACSAPHGCTRGLHGVICYGSDYEGQLGRGNAPFEISPKPANATSVLADAVHIAVGGARSCSTTTDGSLYCWGNNRSPALGVEQPEGQIMAPARVLAFGPPQP